MELKKLTNQQLFAIICEKIPTDFHHECCNHIENNTLTSDEVINVTISLCATILAMNICALTKAGQQKMFTHLKYLYKKNVKDIEDMKNGN